MAIKRKSGKRRSKQSGVASGLLLVLVVMCGLGGVGFAGYLLYQRVIVPVLAEQQAAKLRQEFAAAVDRDGVPAGWKRYSLGQFQMIVPERNKLHGPQIQRLNGDELKSLYFAEAEGVSIGISTLNLNGSAVQFGGQVLERAMQSKLQSIMPRSILQDRFLDGLPRCRELLIDNNGTKELDRWYLESPSSMLIIGIVGDPESARFQEVVRSMTYAVPKTAPPVTPTHLTETGDATNSPLKKWCFWRNRAVSGEGVWVGGSRA